MATSAASPLLLAALMMARAMSQRDLYRTARFGMKLPSNVGDGPVGHPGMAAHLDPMYNPAQHGLRASVRPKTWQGKGPDPGY